MRELHPFSVWDMLKMSPPSKSCEATSSSLPPKMTVPSMKEGELDILTNLQQTEERSEYMYWLGPLWKCKTSLIVNKDNLSFKLVVFENSLSKEIPATVEKELNRKASGNIVIYNTYSSKSQKLVKRTRFETPDGKIYRIDKPVIVPGTTVQEGEIIPGSIEVTVYADIPGENYNIELTDFTIPGFKGDPRFEKFYARSETPMNGGFSGVVKTASLEEIKYAREELQNSLKETLLSQTQIPGDFILYDDAVFFMFDVSDTDTETTKNFVKITENGKLYGVIFNKGELSNYIAKNTTASYDGSDVTVQELEDLKFSLSNDSNFNPVEDEKIDFSLSGEATIVWKIDGVELATLLAGKDKQDFLSIIGEYPNIQTFEAVIRPFWKKTFPENSEDITVRGKGVFYPNNISTSNQLDS